MKVLISNNTGHIARDLLKRWPDRIGHMISPRGWRQPFPIWAADNGRFSPRWTEKAFSALLGNIRGSQVKPRFLAVPDVVCDHMATRREWDKWEPELRTLGVALAYVVQPGCAVCDVPKSADVVFVGGSTQWKRSTIPVWCEHFPRVHVGRINTARWLWVCHDAGAESVDGTGWFRGDREQLGGLYDYLRGVRKRCRDQTLIQFSR